MNRRAPFVRVLAILWATLQLASPGVSAIADGQAARESATQATSHWEATSSARCPVVHAPDCGVCRYLSNAASERTGNSVSVMRAARAQTPRASHGYALSVAAALPRGRAPPAI